MNVARAFGVRVSLNFFSKLMGVAHWLSLAVLCLSPAAPAAELAKATPAQLEFFEQRIRPMLANECYECHGAKKQKGGLRLDSREAVLKGGDSGPALVPGHAPKSLLIQSIRHELPDSEMPKDRPKLSDAVIADFAAWINQGAPDPRDKPPAETDEIFTGWEATFAARKDWWSFKPVQKVSPPPLKDTAWSAHPVDRFLLAPMEARGVVPAPRADRRTLIRRVTFALTGLPPGPEEVRAFVEDTSPDAYAKVVDRLLASPRFGERWARHWMDLMRFAETHGSEGDAELPNAWRYRDYLIRAFNEDVPWDQLIREHIAGDLLPQPRWNRAEQFNESLLGTAHLRLLEHGFNPVDTRDEQIKTVDNQIDVISKAFQALTTSCARCHDHKFDPISARDYYALQGVLASVRPTQVTIDAPERAWMHRDELEKLKDSVRNELAAAWLVSARELGARLVEETRGKTNPPAIPGDEDQSRIKEFERRIAAIEDTGRAAVLAKRGVSNVTMASVMPSALWTFEGNANDSLGLLHGELLDGAVVRNGRLVLDGKGAHARTAPLKSELREKTLEAWVSPATLQQGGGGVVTVESQDGVIFDSIVFAEKQPRKWMAGSDLFRRGKNLAGPEETAHSNKLVHVAIVYGSDNSIAIYRNGHVYGAPYVPSGEGATLRTFAANSARVLLGMRHTGGGNPFFAGEIEEARLYNRALSPQQVKASFEAGLNPVTPEAIAATLTGEQRRERENLAAEVSARRLTFKKQFPDYELRDAARLRTLAALEAAQKANGHPLNLWSQVRGKSGEQFVLAWKQSLEKHATELAANRQFNAEAFTNGGWDLRGGDATQWFRHGANPPEIVVWPGEFSIEPEGERVLSGLWPAGIFTHRLSQKHNGVLTSPTFKVPTVNMSVLVIGGKGAGVRLMLDNYPLGQGGIYPSAEFKTDAPTWVRIDTSYRKGSTAYLEFAPAAELSTRARTSPGAGERSYFGVVRVLFHDSKASPKEELIPVSPLMELAPDSVEALAQAIARQLGEAITAWRDGKLSEPQHVYLDAFVRRGLLPVTTNELPQLAGSIAAYRKLEDEIPAPRRSPGVLETMATDAPYLPRGDHLKPQEPVPRSYLRVASSRPYKTPQSGRLELANEITSPTNTLTARVMVNRVWHHLFGRGLVASVDNFGRLGDQPSHPELLDHLATHFVEHGCSAKELIRYLVTTRAYQLSSEVSAGAREADPDNVLLSHARTRRLEAEAIRDSLLVVSGRLDTNMFGTGANAMAAPNQQRRRSVYLTVRRNSLSPFLETFDVPRPFTTLGRRDATNIPGQSLALLNDPFVIEQAAQWAEQVSLREKEPDARVRSMFETAFARHPTVAELERSHTYLTELEREHRDEKLVWRDFAQSLFNLKEFIYLR